MARPGIVRADTIDLQDAEKPTAANHQKHPQPNGLAPHQASQVQHVMEERHSEEQSLQDAWNATHHTNGDIDGDEQDLRNGEQEKTDGAEEAEGEGEGEGEGDDDMLDRMSSSPSIDDGGYLFSSSPPNGIWEGSLRDSGSLPRSPSSPSTCETFNQSAGSPSSPPCSSSPFTEAPMHLPWQPLANMKDGLALRWGMGSNTSLFDTSFRDDLSALPSQTPTSQHMSASHQKVMYDMRQDTMSRESCSPHESRTKTTFGLGNKSEPENARPQSSTQPTHKTQVASEDYELSVHADIYEHSNVQAHDWNVQGVPNEVRVMRTHMGANGKNDTQNVSHGDRTVLEFNDYIPTPKTSAIPGTTPTVLALQCQDNSEHDSDTVLDDNDNDYDDDDDLDAFLEYNDHFLDSGLGDESLLDAEDIDFEFVYALHTFVATVEGQANATKGDTMVLLDDSNSYWWLVRVVKDSSIGYLPAEHIETPTERLARLNKHRNIDLSATMLSDNSEKSRNPLKKAMRRRNTKTVQFAAPTYVEASDYDYSSDEEGDTIDPYGLNQQVTQNTQSNAIVDEPAVEVKEPTAAESRSSTSSNRASFDREQAAMAASALAAAGVGDDEPQLSPKLIDKTEAAPLKSRKGTPRNTDSFLKDDTIETRKITLTPGILREDNGPLKSPTESVRTASMESLHKVSSPPEEPKKDGDKKKKDGKKGGMLSGLFKSKKKDKKSKDASADGDEKVSFELTRSNSSQSGKASPVDRFLNGQSKTKAQDAGPQRAQTDAARNESKSGPQTFYAELEGSEVAMEMATGEEDTIPIIQARSKEGPLAGILKSSDKDGRPKKVKRAKQRVELDDFDTPAKEKGNPFEEAEDDDEDEEDDPMSETFMHGTEIVHIPMPGEDGMHGLEDENSDDEEDPESLTSAESVLDQPAEPADPTAVLDRQPSNSTKRPAQEDPAATGAATAAAAAAPTGRTNTPQRGDSNASTTHLSPPPPPPPAETSPTSPTAPAAQQVWNDHSLRAWLEDGSEVRDMLVMIHDKSGITPVAPDHPLMAGLFVTPRKGVQDMMGQLDGLLGDYLQRKGVRY